jgi:hypothetical protein
MLNFLLMSKPFLLMFLAVPALLSAGAYTLTIDVTEDQIDNLIIQGNTLEWRHIQGFANGGVTGGSLSMTNYLGNTQTVNNPFILVSGTNASYPVENFTNSHWYNGIQGFQCSTLTGGCPFNDVNFEFTLPFALNATSISISNLITPPIGGFTAIVQQPTVGNNGVAIVQFNDALPGGTHEYKLQISWTGADQTPEPATIGLSAIGLAALGTAAWRRRAAR